MNKAHIEHAVGFVEHQRVDSVEADCAALHVIEQAAGGGDDNVHPMAQFRDLRVDADATEDHDGSERQVPAVIFYTLADLGRKLARRHEYQRTDAILAPIGIQGLQPLQKRQGEAGGLARDRTD